MRFLTIALALAGAVRCCAQTSAPLPPGVKAVWDAAAAVHETTPTRDRVCLNGLWRWQPAAAEPAPPAERWGWFKVPGCWPGITDYLQKDCQTLITHAAWQGTRLGEITSAWYQREITVPAGWTGRRVLLSADYVNSAATAFIDGKKAGEILFPGGKLDVTALCAPGSKHLLSLLVTAMPLKAVMLAYTDTNNARQVRGSVARRGLCGDVWLESEPRGPRLGDIRIETSYRQKKLTLDAAVSGLANQVYILRLDLTDANQKSRRITLPISPEKWQGGRLRVSIDGMASSLWDVHTPQNQLVAHVSILEPAGKQLDAALPVRFGFREFWIDGKDFYLNGSRIWLSALPIDSAQVSTQCASYEGARETLLRLKSFGINFVYTHNYDCEPGSHLSFEEILRAADDVGMLVALTQPHFSAYDWNAPDADKTNGYARHAAFYARVAGSHPCVVAYATSHNATSYDEAKNPDRIDGADDPRQDGWSRNGANKALRAEAIIKSLDPSRIVYHHSSGNLGSMYTENFYVNFVPQQELSDWFEHWSTKGVKPLFLCEYGNPFSWDWAMYRGWYKGKREWGSARVPWELCIAEWNAQFHGDRAYEISEREKQDLRWEAKQFRTRDGWYRWDYPTPIGSSAFAERDPIFASYITDNWRAYRTLGVSATSPWEYEIYWRLRDGLDRRRKELPVDWDHLQRPGYNADYLGEQYDMMPYSYARADWQPTVAAEALYRNNMPLLAYIGDANPHVTGKGHNFRPGDLVQKQLILINNSRQHVTADCRWALSDPDGPSGTGTIMLETGQMKSIALAVQLPARIAPGRHSIQATVKFSTGETQTDSITFDVLARPAPVSVTGLPKIGLFDPQGETAKLLDGLGVKYQRVDATTDLSGYSALIIGKHAITLENAIPDVRRVRDGMRVIVFEQSKEALEQRLGFRVAEYGLRQTFPRVVDHPLLAGLSAEKLHDWRGEATNSTPRLQYTLKPMYGPMVKWCGIEVPHVWRAGCRGNVASVLIEKPARGDFMPIIDGGFSLQYSPLMVYREGTGMMLFCQMDVTGRTESDPAADQLARNILQFTANWKPSPQRTVAYTGLREGRAQLQASGIQLANGKGDVLVAGPGADRQIVGMQQRSGGDLVELAETEAETRLFFPNVSTHPAEHISCYFPVGNTTGATAGISPADLHLRDPRQVALITGGATPLGDGVVAAAPGTTFCQLAPWEFDVSKPNTKRTFRHTSFLLTRLLCNLGAACTSPLLDDFAKPATATDKRWLDGLYLDTPEEWDDPYRFFPW